MGDGEQRFQLALGSWRLLPRVLRGGTAEVQAAKTFVGAAAGRIVDHAFAL